jgi:hypothetical protein
MEHKDFVNVVAPHRADSDRIGPDAHERAAAAAGRTNRDAPALKYSTDAVHA